MREEVAWLCLGRKMEKNRKENCLIVVVKSMASYWLSLEWLEFNQHSLREWPYMVPLWWEMVAKFQPLLLGFSSYNSINLVPVV